MEITQRFGSRINGSSAYRQSYRRGVRVLGRGKKHISSSKENGVSALMKGYIESNVHIHKPSRKAIGNEIEGHTEHDALSIQTGDFLTKWDEKTVHLSDSQRSTWTMILNHLD